MLADFKDKKITLMGLGLHGGGLGAALFLARRGACLTITDLKPAQRLVPSLKKLHKHEKQITYVLGRHREKDFTTADLVVKNPDVPPASVFLKIARRHGIPVESDLSLFFKLCPARIVGVTGTRGKSTTASLAHHILRRRDQQAVLGGNIRQSPLLFLDKIGKDTPVVLELSSWQLEDLARHRLSPAIAVMTSFYPDHLNRHKTMAAYLAAKKSIFRFQHSRDQLVLNYDLPVLHRLSKEAPGSVGYFSVKKVVRGAYFQRGALYLKTGKKSERLIYARDLKIFGAYNIANALAASLASFYFGAPLPAIRQGLKSFSGLPDRQELVRRLNGVTFINDTTSTIPESTIIALHNFKGRIILLAGGASKGLAYPDLATAIIKRVRQLILFRGEASEEILAALKARPAGKKVPFTVVDSMRQAVTIAWERACRGDTVILSPAAASFGLFENEFDRSKQFKEAVKKLT